MNKVKENSSRKRVFFNIIIIVCITCFVVGCTNTSDNPDSMTAKTITEENKGKFYSEEDISAEETIDSSEEELRQNEDLNDLSEYMRVMPNVSNEMQYADYWINKLKSPDKIIMDNNEICKYNEYLLTEKSFKNRFLEYSEEEGSRRISQEKLIAYLDEAELPEPAYYKDGSPVTEDDISLLKDNLNYDGVKENNDITYGFAVARESIRQYPTDKVITQDKPFTFYDEMQNSLLLVGEPVIILLESKDQKWEFVMTESCSGWIKKEYIAKAESYKQWKVESEPEKFLIITGDEIQIDYDPTFPELSSVRLTMGCKLPLVPWEKCKQSEEGREAFGNYVVKLPCRDQKAKVKWKYIYIPISKDVSVGYLEYTQRNVLVLAFKSLGRRYGWGGMYQARDCSLYLMEIYRCFGINLPRNSSGISEMNTKTISTEGMPKEEKHKKILEIPAGSILYLKGHVMMYLGSEGEQDYVISASATSIPDGSEKKNSVHSVVINDLEAKRINGKTWIDCIEKCKIITVK